MNDPTMYLAHCDGAQGDNILKGERDVMRISQENAPALLISFWYLKPFLEHQSEYRYRHWALDSGAFSAMNSGAVIDLTDYIKTCKRLMETDPTLQEIFALDAIGNPEQTKENTRIMWEEGIPAIPCFHYGSPERYLMELAEKYPKIAIGGCARRKSGEKMKFARQVFARVWPKAVHGFGFGSEAQIMDVPFHSVDATNWELGPCAFGRWASFKGSGGGLSWKGSKQNLQNEISHYLDIEERARVKWKRQMEELGMGEGATVRLAVISSGREGALKEGKK